jgi:hypothetical protein
MRLCCSNDDNIHGPNHQRQGCEIQIPISHKNPSEFFAPRVGRMCSNLLIVSLQQEQQGSFLHQKRGTDLFVRTPLLGCFSDELKLLWIEDMQTRYGNLLNDLYWFEERNEIKHSVLFFAICNTEHNICLVFEDLVPGAIEDFSQEQQRRAILMGLVSTSLDQPTINLSSESRNKWQGRTNMLKRLEKMLSLGKFLFYLFWSYFDRTCHLSKLLMSLMF